MGTKSLREDFLQQNAFNDIDTYCSLNKQYKMLDTILKFYDAGLKALEKGAYLKEIEESPVIDKIARMKYIAEENISNIDSLQEEIAKEMKSLERGGTEEDA